MRHSFPWEYSSYLAYSVLQKQVSAPTARPSVAHTVPDYGWWPWPGLGLESRRQDKLLSHGQGCRLTTLTATTEVSEDIIALLRKSNLVDSVSDEACLQQPTGILAGLPALRETLHVMIKPVYHIRA